jgi:hypothetical protein
MRKSDVLHPLRLMCQPLSLEAGRSSNKENNRADPTRRDHSRYFILLQQRCGYLLAAQDIRGAFDHNRPKGGFLQANEMISHASKN